MTVGVKTKCSVKTCPSLPVMTPAAFSAQPTVMSIEYTIDIQLTELGFPDILPTSNIETGRCKPLNSSQSLQDEQADRETAHDEPSEPSAHDVTAGDDTTDPPQLITGQDNKGKKHGDTAQEEEEDDSDDSDVSEMYEEEEVDEDDEDEEGLNTGRTDYL